MRIVLHCGGIPFNGRTIHEKSLGGSETAAYHVARELASRGHVVRLFTNSPEEGEWDGVEYVFAGKITDATPLGDRFEAYAQNSYHDLLIIQRHPLGLRSKYAAKQAYFWLHDLALARNKPAFDTGCWQANGVFVVSEFHKKQVETILNIQPGFVLPITNGVDPERFATADVTHGQMLRMKAKPNAAANDEAVNAADPFNGEFAMIYSSRPERGLEHLVRPGGIMERLAKEAPNAHLYICNYEHAVPEMAAYYAQLKAFAAKLPNVTTLGHLTQFDLACVMKSVQLHIYPTEFEEVSCITAMECMWAGIPQLVSKCAAIPETTKGAGVILVDHKDGVSDEDLFVKHAARLATKGVEGVEYQQLVERQKKCATKYTWSATADQILGHVSEAFKKAQSNIPSLLRHLIYWSDIQAARVLLDRINVEKWKANPIFARCLEELELYRFADSKETYSEHYAAGTAKFYDGPEYKGPEDVSGNPRFRAVADRVGRALADRPAGDGRRLVLVDVGCAHGHQSVGLARRFPDIDVVGLDVSPRAIEEAKRAANEAGVGNTTFLAIADGDWEGARAAVAALKDGADLVLLGEVLEHMFNPWDWANSLFAGLARDGACVVTTTPIGPWEMISYHRDHPWRYHLAHLEIADLEDMFEGFENFEPMLFPSGPIPTGDLLGHYVTTFKWSADRPVNSINYDRKLAEIMPRETVALCMIVKDGEHTLRRTLDRVLPIVDQVIVGIDKNSKDDTAGVLERVKKDYPLWPVVSYQNLHSALEEGFDAARNATIDDAATDWALWLDGDEDLVNAESLVRYLRPNCFNGYAIQQHHFSVYPAGILMTDLPSRAFRTDKGIRFLGCVHEHPEKGENEGVGAAMLIGEVSIAHHGYYTEPIRRARFQRNFALMQRDRQTNPKRKLGKFLWIRDLSHMMTFVAEQTRGNVTSDMQQWAREAITLFEDILKDGDIKIILDSLQYYSNAVRVLGGGVEMAFKMDAQRGAEAGTHRAQEIRAMFADRSHAERVHTVYMQSILKPFDTKYW